MVGLCAEAYSHDVTSDMYSYVYTLHGMWTVVYTVCVTLFKHWQRRP